MTTCSTHHQTPAAGSCEDCGEPFCGACLKPLLGRAYCPDCYQRVQQIAGGGPQPKSHAPYRQLPYAVPIVPVDPVPGPPAPRLPGWASTLIYLLGFVLIYVVLQGVQGAVMMLVSMARSGPVDMGQLSNPKYAQELIGPERMGLPTWCGLMFFFGWADLLVVAVYTGLLSHWLERRSLRDLGLRLTRSLPRDIPAGIVLAGVLFVSVVGVGIARGWYSAQLASGPGKALLIALIGAVILLPYAAIEEVSMRGYVLQSASRTGGRWVGVVVSTVAFALLHCMNPGFQEHPLAVVGLLLAGLYLASAYLITGNLWLAIFLHTGWNLMEGPVFGLDVSGIEMSTSVVRTRVTGPDLWTGGSFGPEAGLLLCLLMLVHLAALWALRPWLRPEAVPAVPDGEPLASGRAAETRV